MLAVAAVWPMTAGKLAAADVVVRGDAQALAPCASLAWAPQERVPVFDALTPPDTEEARRKLEATDRLVREITGERLQRRGRRLEGNEAPCLVSYTVFQELDLDIARHGSGTIAPRSSDPVGGGNPEAGPHSQLKQVATFTLTIRLAGSDQILWQGELKEPVGTAKQVPKGLEKIVRRVADAVPKP